MGMQKLYPSRTQARVPPQCSICLCMSSTRTRAPPPESQLSLMHLRTKLALGGSLNDTLLVGPTVHRPLIDALLRFQMHRIALTTDMSKMYRAIELVPSDRDFHSFVWRSKPNQTLKNYRMTRATFGVSASCFAANMAVKQNTIELVDKYPLAIVAVHNSST